MLSLSFENVQKRFDSTIVVRDLSLEIGAGELFFLLGPSGCGKTTCLRMVAGFYRPDGGQLRFGDRVINAVPPHKRNTGMVFQNYALWPHLNVRGNVEYGLKVRKVPTAERERRVKEALEMVRLGHLADRYPSQMSGGQQQRVALARALVVRPDVLLLDEPLSNLDAQLRLEMRAEIKRLHREQQTTALYVTHDQEEALSIADRVAILRDGDLMQVGAPRDLYRAPNSRFVAEFIGETNFLPGQIKAINADSLDVQTAVGPLRSARPTGNWAIDQPVWCSIRPESWHLLTEGQKAQNEFSATLEDAMYLGQAEQLIIRLGGGREATTDETWRTIKVAVANPDARPPAIGGAVRVGVDVEDVVVLAE
ncbi:putative 2-aminoethylphosphonate import ATP-binding protein PhnT [Abditibacteriota bacterium]|nr:putative 2-aminoethylphosphonate import ATP-binding protein PhnT [Abditibacteriota bacterium]